MQAIYDAICAFALGLGLLLVWMVAVGLTGTICYFIGELIKGWGK